MIGKQDSRHARQFAGDFFIGIAVFLSVLALAVCEPQLARSAPAMDFAAKDHTLAEAGSTPQLPKNENFRFPADETSPRHNDFEDDHAKYALRLGGHDVFPTAPSGARKSAAGQPWMLPVMALVFGLMTALTLGLWRHLRHSIVTSRRRRRTG